VLHVLFISNPVMIHKIKRVAGNKWQRFRRVLLSVVNEVKIAKKFSHQTPTF